MPTYYALVSQNCIQQDLNTGQLEIYKDKASANKVCPTGCEVVEVEISRLNTQSGLCASKEKLSTGVQNDDDGQWWVNLLQERANEGKSDADKGMYSLPCSEYDDPQNKDENAAYHRGFMDRRKELGDKFKWR